MRFFGEAELCRERARFMQTIESLTDEEFDHGTTLCDGWAPRDVLAHIISTDHLPYWYLRPSTLFGVGPPVTPTPGAVRHLARPEQTDARPETTRKTRLETLAQQCHIVGERGNGLAVHRLRNLSRAQLTQEGWVCAERPTFSSRLIGILLLGDVAMHHQDVLRGLGRYRDVPDEVASALFREGRIWSWAFGAKQLRYRVYPTTTGGFPCGRGTPVAGTTEALALWLAGRPGIEPDLKFD